MSNPSSDNQKKNSFPNRYYLNVRPNIPSLPKKRPGDATNIPPPKYTQIKFIPVQQKSAVVKPEIAKPIVELPKTEVTPSVTSVTLPPSVKIDNEMEEIGAVALEPEQPPIVSLPLADSSTNIEKTSESPKESEDTEGIDEAETFLNNVELRRRIQEGCRRRGLVGATDKSVELLQLAAHDRLKEDLEEIIEISRNRAKAALDDNLLASAEEDLNQFTLLGEVQERMQAQKMETGEAQDIPEENIVKEKVIANEAALIAVAKRRISEIQESRINAKKNVLRVQIKDCLEFLESSGNLRRGEVCHKFLFPPK